MASNVKSMIFAVCVFVVALSVVKGYLFTSKISLHLDAACGLFTEELMDEGGKCDPDVIEEVMDEADEIEGLGGIDGEKIEDYLEEAEEGKMCYSPDGENVTNLKDGCSAMEAVCNEQANVMYCKEMATVTNTQ
eukprot:XP_011672112.1 PREDICTED: uncharacterized protein LOC105442051 [Strongylocentrotus purpuratus]